MDPLYVQIAEGLKAEIGALAPGARIPSEPQLAKEWGVSRFTVTKAVERLVDEGLVTRRQGSGSFVAEAPLRSAPGFLLSFTEAATAAGHQASHRLLAFGPAEPEAGLPYRRGESLVLLDRLRFVDGDAVARHRSILSAKLVAEIGLTHEVVAGPTFSLYRHLEERGRSVDSATERLIARAPSSEERRLLALPGNAVVVAVIRHSFAADGTPLDAVGAVYDARRYSYEARLVRQHVFGSRPARQENAHDEIVRDRGAHGGPRLGPWDDHRDRGREAGRPDHLAERARRSIL